MTRVVVADGQVLERARLAAMLRTSPALEVVGEAANSEETLALAAALDVDTILMDAELPGEGAIATIERVSALNGQTARVLVLVTAEPDDFAYAALRAGAGGFIQRQTPTDRVIAAITVVAHGDMLVSPSVARRLLDGDPGVGTAGEPPDPLAPLTARELDVLRLVGRGMTNPEIAERLVVGENTVKTHLNRTMAKLGVSTRAQAVVAAYESGLIVPRDTV